MGQKKTPLILKLRETGGTLYVFPSAGEDVGLNLQSTTTGVAMSHYALLNIPELSINKCLCESGTTATSGNQALLMSLLNYMMNFETHLTNRDSYNYQALSTVSERAFWHWAMKIGILNPSTLIAVPDQEGFYMESGRDTSASITDDTVIKCFGAIDAGNTLSTEFGMYNETYINVPTSYGAGPVYLKTVDDENFHLNHVYVPDSSGHLEGRGDEYLYYSYTMGQDIPFFDKSNTYVTSDIDGLEIVKDIPTIQKCARKQFDNDSITLGSYDDINIDLDGLLNVDIKYEFNAILLYYSVYDQDDMIKTAYATNLFGIIFLDGARAKSESETDTIFYIPTKTKLKSTTTNFGDSFSFRVNLKTMSVYDNTDAIIQDNTTMSGIAAVDFSDAISNMNKAIDIMNSNVQTTMAIQDKYAAIMAYYDSLEDKIDDLSTCLNAYLKGARSSIVNTSTLYTNVVAPNPTNASNDIKFYTIAETNGAEVTLNQQPAIYMAADNTVTIPTLYTTTVTNKNSYVILSPNTYDVSVMNASIKYTNRNSSIAYETVQRMFSSYEDLLIKLKVDSEYYTDTLRHNKEYNHLYIDPTSPMFDNIYGSELNINYLKDSSDNINYVGLVPYLIALVQKLTQENKKLREDVDSLLNK